VYRAGSDNVDSIESIDKLQHRVREGVSKLKGLEIGDELAVEVLANLVEGRRTVSEIVQLLYGLRISDEGYQSCFSRVRRELRKLESKGLVSRKLLGRDKPYRLTQLAVSNLARIGGEEAQLSLIPRIDIAAYIVTLVLSVPNALQAMNWIELAGLPTIALLTSFCFFLGISFYGAVRSIRKVL
jgi:hypothetical protein